MATYPTLDQCIAVTEKNLSRALVLLAASISDREPGCIDDDYLRFLEGQLPELVNGSVRLRALRDAKLSINAS